MRMVRIFFQMARRYIDIGVNLTDQMYQGVYNGKKKHGEDLAQVLGRSFMAGIEKLIITGSSLSDSEAALKLSQTNDRLFCTVGCHPTHCKEFEQDNLGPEHYMSSLLKLALSNKEKVVAIGECGLDYERTQFCDMEVQKKYFEKQISLAVASGLPMFLHCRRAAEDLVNILRPLRDKICGAVVHSFDGTLEEMEKILELDLYIGVNGCSLKTDENLSIASKIPVNRLLIETDAPWCEIRPTHSGFQHIKTRFPSRKKEKWDPTEMVKTRNEPCCIVNVFEVLSAIRTEDEGWLGSALYENTTRLFFQGK